MESDERPDFLVVEDDDDDFFLVSDLLRTELAYAAEQVRSVDEALERIAAREFALILLDYSLGARNGLDLLAELRARDNITPVIFLTGHGDEQVAVRALKGGAVDYLAKSNMTRESLAAAVRHALALRDRDAAVREAREALSAREREYRTLFEKANDAIFIIDPETEIVLEANPAAARLYGVEHDQLIGRSLIDFSTDIVRGRHAIDECVAAGELANFETIHISRDGRRLHLLLNSSLIEYRGRSALLNLCRDISERKAAEQEIFRLNRALKALSKCNEALLRARQPQQFLEEICDIMVQVGGYRMAWVAARPAGREDRVEPLAISGTDRDYVEAVCNRYGNLETSPLLVPTALRTGAPAVCRDTSTSPLEARNDCLEHGFASIIALPLTREGRVLGALAIYAGERDAFDNAEVDLLRELAGDVSYGLDSIEAREQRERAEVELKSSETRLRNLIETANEGIWTIDAEERTTFVNAKMAAMLGRIPEEMLGTHIKEFIYAGQHELIDVSMMERRAMARGHYEVMLVNKDGGHIITSLNSSPILDGNGHYAGALGMLTDITEQKQAEKKLRESEQRYRTLFERNLAGVFRATANGTLLEANDAFRRMLGYDTNDDFPALTLPQMCAAAGCAERWHEKLIATGQLVNLEISILRKDGGTAYLLANLVTVGREAGGVSREVAPQLSSLKTQASSPAPPFIEGTVLDVTA
ncbi:MAG: PAS domain S-box protein, partial [Terriglobales bacterium]